MKRIMERIGFLESKYTADNIQNAFGQIRTTMETSAPPPTTQSTRRSLSQCEKRQIAEKHRCKEDTCFRHQCLKDGHFSPGQCWPKEGFQIDLYLGSFNISPLSLQIVNQPLLIKLRMSNNLNSFFEPRKIVMQIRSKTKVYL